MWATFNISAISVVQCTQFQIQMIWLLFYYFLDIYLLHTSLHMQNNLCSLKMFLYCYKNIHEYKLHVINVSNADGKTAEDRSHFLIVNFILTFVLHLFEQYLRAVTGTSLVYLVFVKTSNWLMTFCRFWYCVWSGQVRYFAWTGYQTCLFQVFFFAFPSFTLHNIVVGQTHNWFCIFI